LAAAHIHLFHVDAGAEQQPHPGQPDDQAQAAQHDRPVMAQRGEEPDQQQSPVTQAGQVGFGSAARGFPGPSLRAGGQDVEQVGWH